MNINIYIYIYIYLRFSCFFLFECTLMLKLLYRISDFQLTSEREKFKRRLHWNSVVITNFMNINVYQNINLIRSVTIYSHMRCPCVYVLFVSSTSDIVFKREPVQCRPQPIGEGGSPVFYFQLYMEDAGNRNLYSFY